MKIAFYTLGCKVNQYETRLLKEKSEELGYKIVDFNNVSDIYVINSCSVTNMSDRKTRQMVSKARKNNNNSIVVLIGCNVESIKDTKYLNNYNADILLGNIDKYNMFYELEKYRTINKNKTNKNKLIKITNLNEQKKMSCINILKKGYNIREVVKIEDGCNNFCSYCIIPYLRGKVQSKKKQDVICEIKNLVKNNVKEIVLVGIEISSYGTDLKDCSLIDLIETINKIDKLERIRLSSLDPRFLTETNIKKMSKIDKLCNHFHISMQSLDEDILKSMNRKYTVEDLYKTCDNLRKYFNEPYIATDIIVGFPGETEKMFNNTFKNLKKIKPAEIHVFKYSKRRYTKAAEMKEQIDGEVKNLRSKKIIQLSKINNQDYLKKYLKKESKVLFEHFKNDINIGVTSNYIKFKVKGNINLCGTVQDVVGISLNKGNIIGKIK